MRDTQNTSQERETVSLREERVMQFWRENNIFNKSEKGIAAGVWRGIRTALLGKKHFVFYDGPPFATGLPHYGHILASAVKDAIPRYKTMRGYTMRRQWGWDCHGLPLEVEMEKELGIKTKKDIEEYGIEKFNANIRRVILRYADEWKKVIPRIGRWVDMENDYRTVTTAYMESVWSVFHRLHKNGFVSRGFKSMHLCPRCSTVVSNTEVADSYETLTDTAVFVLFPLKRDQDTMLVAWTTTPWTLFGNVALGIDRTLDYSVIEKEGKKYILHPNAAGHIAGGKTVGTKRGEEYEGEEYLPPFEYLYADETEAVREKVWRVRHVPYIDPEVGTGIVHLAPAYGAEDMETAQDLGLPIRHHVSKDGVFIEKLGDFAGLRPKEGGNPKEVEKQIIAALRESGRLLKDEEIEHSYPLCWRCKTPLLNYAADSWFVHAERFRNRMVTENKKVSWVPEHIRDGRFGNWLANAREWAVSRSRFWGTPLPVWEVEKTGEYIFVDSLETMLNRMRARNRYLFIRHGETISNVKRVVDNREEEGTPLTETGREQAKTVGKALKQEKPDIVFCSPFKRTRETAEYIAEATGAAVRTDPLLGEIQIPNLHGRPITEFYEAVRKVNAFKNRDASIAGGESHRDIYLRTLAFLEKIDRQYEGKTIVVVTHKGILCAAKAIAPTEEESRHLFLRYMRALVPNTSTHEITYLPLHRTKRGEIDIHRPYIDDIILYDDSGNPARHIGEVFDCWFESGAMPYGSHHYPFRRDDDSFNEDESFDPLKKKGFPADFICESMDQTRGWFYSMMAIAVGMFGKTPYRQVICNGIIRAADGKKMSKSLKNYTDPMNIVEKYGADSLRHYLLGSPVVRGEDIVFKDEQVAEIYKKVYARLHNCLNFYTTYAHLPHKRGSRHLLDRYILSRLAETRDAMTAGLEAYRLDEAIAPITPFVDDLSTWYIRRSRERIRRDSKDGAHARATLHRVLLEYAKCIAPIAPFYAEHLFQEMARYTGRSVFLPESVHLCGWVKRMPREQSVLTMMNKIRSVVSSAHEQRSAAGIRVRQPLAKLTINIPLPEEARRIIADEVNVKTITVSQKQTEAALLDTKLTDALREEGFIREFIRAVQNIRKEKKFSMTEVLGTMHLHLPEKQKNQISRFEEQIRRETRVREISYETAKPEHAETVIIEGVSTAIALREKPEKIFRG